MSSEEKKIVDFVFNLPPNVNPYAAVAQRMKELMVPPRLSTGATIAQRLTIVFLLILFIQSVHLVYARIRAGAFKLCSFTRLGLYHVDIATTTGLMWAIYSLLAIVDFTVLDFVNFGKRDLSGELVLFGCKYIPVLANAWFYLWVCAGQCASLVCESGLGEASGTGKRLHPVIRVAMNGSLLVAFFLPTPSVIYYYATVNAEYDMAKSILQGVLHSLATKAANATPQNYNRVELLAMLIPARNMLPHGKKIAALVRRGIMVYLAEIAVLGTLYLPLLVFCLSRMYGRSVSQKHLSQGALDGDESDAISNMSRKIREQRSRIIRHATITYVSIFLHVPVIIAQLSYKGDRFLQDKSWMTLTRVGLGLPFSVVGNMMSFILNVRARNQLIEVRNQKASSSAMTFSGRGNELLKPRYNANLGEQDIPLPGLPTHLDDQTLNSRSKSIVQESSVHFNENLNDCQIDQRSEVDTEEFGSKDWLKAAV